MQHKGVAQIEMARSIKIDGQERLARFIFTGSVDDVEARDVERAMVDARRSHGCNRVLCDMRQARLAMSIYEVDNVPVQALEAGIDSSFRIAMVYSDDERKFQHLENVATIHGLDYRNFTEEARALEWLKELP